MAYAPGAIAIIVAIIAEIRANSVHPYRFFVI
jgi:hypothetical protein